LLLRRHSEIRKLAALRDETQHAIEERIRYSTRPPAEIWHDFEQLSSQQAPSLGSALNALSSSYRIIEGLARQSSRYVKQILSILRRSGDEPKSWMEICAIRLAGEMRLTAAIPCLIDFLG